MKQIMSVIGALLLLFDCSENVSSNKQTDDSLSVVITDVEQSHSDMACLHLKGGNKYDFGKIDLNTTNVIPVNVEIENTGKKPLIIYKADVSCGCVSVEFPHKPVQVGKTAIIHIKINTKEQNGYFNKAVFIKSNASNDVELIRITGQIK